MRYVILLVVLSLYFISCNNNSTEPANPKLHYLTVKNNSDSTVIIKIWNTDYDPVTFYHLDETLKAHQTSKKIHLYSDTLYRISAKFWIADSDNSSDNGYKYSFMEEHPLRLIDEDPDYFTIFFEMYPLNGEQYRLWNLIYH